MTPIRQRVADILRQSATGLSPVRIDEQHKRTRFYGTMARAIAEATGVLIYVSETHLHIVVAIAMLEPAFAGRPLDKVRTAARHADVPDSVAREFVANYGEWAVYVDVPGLMNDPSDLHAWLQAVLDDASTDGRPS